MKKFFIALMGGTVLLVGLALLVLPGPGVPIIAAGLAMLATEFLWAKRALRKTQGVFVKASHMLGIREWLRRRTARFRPTPKGAHWAERFKRPLVRIQR